MPSYKDILGKGILHCLLFLHLGKLICQNYSGLGPPSFFFPSSPEYIAISEILTLDSLVEGNYKYMF